MLRSLLAPHALSLPLNFSCYNAPSGSLEVCVSVEMSQENGNVHVIADTAAWKAKVEEAKTTGKTIVVDFTATWCGPCRFMAPIFAALSLKFENLLFVKVDVDDLREVAAEWEVRAMPTFMFIKDGKQVDKLVGANKFELEKKCVAASNMIATV